jgi:hypothetical protein
VRKTPEIPEDVFFEDEKPAAAVPASQEAVMPAKPQAVKQSKRQAVKQSSGQKVQVTVYLSEEVLRELERARFELLSRHHVRASKSAIAEWAIAQAGADLGAMAEALRDAG